MHRSPAVLGRARAGLKSLPRHSHAPLSSHRAARNPRIAAASTPPPPSIRHTYATQSAGPPSHQVFNPHVKWLQKERAASDAAQSRQADYLREEVAARLCERLLDIRRTYPLALDLGAHSCNLARALVRPDPDPAAPAGGSEPVSSRFGRLVAAESSRALLYRDADLPLYAPQEGQGEADGKPGTLELERQVLESDESLPWDADTFDLVLSSLHLHWINDLPGVLGQVNHVLKPDSAFVAAMLGGDTLYELRTSLQLAEQERRGGISPRVSPLADVRDVGGLLQRAGFRFPTVDVDDIVVDYPDVFALMQDLQAMGESSAVLGREMGPVPRDVLLAADPIYKALHGNEDGTIPATFRIIYMIGWKAGEGQAQPLPRGSGQVSLKDVLEQKK